ncbi:MAG: 3-hydroxyacyl-CoA dehydrogenase NAD-binding domain-containing protein, partial [Bacteroidota bacterium]
MSEIVDSIDSYALSQKSKSKTLFSKVGLLGSGPVGQSIARMVSQRGMEIIFIESNEKKITAVIKEIENELDRMISRWGMTNGEKTAILNRI